MPEIFNQRPTGFLIGKDVVDQDQPQLQVGKLLLDDPKPLINPRPDRSLDESESYRRLISRSGGARNDE